MVLLAWCGIVAVGFVITGQAVAEQRPRWTTLSEAASRPVGVGDHGVAEGVRGSTRPGVPVRSVLPSPAAGNGGCERAYGDGGQCLPVVPPSQAEHVAAGHAQPLWTCRELRRYFPSGLLVARAGVDPLHLDHDGDGTACGNGD